MLTAALFIAVIAGNISANLLLKVGAVEARWPCIGGGLACFAVAMLAYLALLRRVPLSVAQGIVVLQVVGGIVGAWLILGEPVPPWRWIGIGLVVGGSAIIAWSYT